MTKGIQKPLTINVTGLTTEQILNMDINDINRMNSRTLNALASRLVSSMNKRIRNLREKAPYSPALESLPKGYLFSVKGLNRNEVRSLVGQMMQFGQMSTSTVSGYKKTRKKIEKKLGGKLSNLKDEPKFWDVYRRLQESNHAIFQKLSSEAILKMLYDEAIDKPDEDLFDRMNENLDDIYNALEGNVAEDDIWGDYDELNDEEEDDEDYF